MTSINLPKSGENIITGTISRYKSHLKLRFKTHPVMEELFMTYGGNERSLVQKYGRLWEGKDEDSTRNLACWNLISNPGVSLIDPTRGYYCLDRIGGPISEFRSNIGERDHEVLNMSWLRLVGISEGAGIEIAIRGVFSPAKVEEISEKIKYAARVIYISYIKPINITVGVFTQPWEEPKV